MTLWRNKEKNRGVDNSTGQVTDFFHTLTFEIEAGGITWLKDTEGDTSIKLRLQTLSGFWFQHTSQTFIRQLEKFEGCLGIWCHAGTMAPVFRRGHGMLWKGLYHLARPTPIFMNEVRWSLGLTCKSCSIWGHGWSTRNKIFGLGHLLYYLLNFWIHLKSSIIKKKKTHKLPWGREERKRGSGWAEGEVRAPGKERDAAGSPRTLQSGGSSGARVRSETVPQATWQGRWHPGLPGPSRRLQSVWSPHLGLFDIK